MSSGLLPESPARNADWLQKRTLRAHSDAVDPLVRDRIGAATATPHGYSTICNLPTVGLEDGEYPNLPCGVQQQMSGYLVEFTHCHAPATV